MKKIRLYLPAIFWMVLIFFLSSRPGTSVADNQILNFIFFKSLHLIEYSVLFFLVYWANKKTFNFSFWEAVLLSFILTIIYAISDEIHQIFVPTREGKLRDVLIDTFGTFLGSLVVRIKKLDY